MKGTEKQQNLQFIFKARKPCNRRDFGTGIINNNSQISIEQITPVHNTFPVVCWIPLHGQITSVFGSYEIIRLWIKLEPKDLAQISLHA